MFMKDKRIDKMNGRKIILRILSNELAPSFGCTEPAAVGLATSIAYNAVKGILPSWLKPRNTTATILNNLTQENIEKSIVELDRFTYRNGLDVDIPGTRSRGISVAAAQGVFCHPTRSSVYSKTQSRERLKDRQTPESWQD
jgi:L-cysteine desulfidase